MQDAALRVLADAGSRSYNEARPKNQFPRKMNTKSWVVLFLFAITSISVDFTLGALADSVVAVAAYPPLKDFFVNDALLFGQKLYRGLA